MTTSGVSTAMVFPGMGPVPFRDVGRFMVADRRARELVAVADDVLGYSLVDALRTAEGDYSEAAQVAFLVNCLACARWAEDVLGVEATVCAGPSFGEKAAVAYAGALPLADAVRMTLGLARCMDDYFAREFTDIVTHSFVRTPAAELATIRAELDAEGEWNELSCRIDDDFFMLSLPESRVEWLSKRLRSVGGLSLYTMRPPMHAAPFAPLRAEAAGKVLDALPFTDPRIPVVADQDGALLRTADEIRTMLLDGFTRALDWPATVAGLRAAGARRICVAGPDSLFGRVGVTTTAFEVVPALPRSALMPRVALAA
jgi:[acyl-carrier-protein] S-malonyltransferase